MSATIPSQDILLDAARLLPQACVVVATERHAQAALHADEAGYAGTRAMSALRRLEFVQGRACAREALARLDVHDWPLLPTAQRDPRWPDGIAGSISHCGGACVAAVAPAAAAAGIGIDIEALDRIDARIAPRVCSGRELRRLRRSGAPIDRVALCRVFSAKESAFKAVFPLLRRSFDFTDIEVRFDAKHTRFRAGAAEPALDRLLRRVRGRCATGSAFVLTTAIVRRGERVAAGGVNRASRPSHARQEGVLPCEF